MGSLIGLFARWGLPESIRRPLAWVTTAIAALAFLWGVKALYDRSHDKARDAEITAETTATDSAAKIEAAERRADDKAAIADAEKDRNDAISQATDSKPSDASIRLNCERLRKAGKDASRIAACSGLGR